ncbi:MAG: HNH endonuclease [Oscillospiraceae bacterium]
MRCLFCKKDSAATKSIEHIIPESLGNSTYVLPIGYVCDKCNNYFAREVEKPFLERLDMQLLRFYEAVPNKKKKIPRITGMIDLTPVTVRKDLINGKIVTGIDVSPDLFYEIENATAKMQLVIPALNESNLPKQGQVTSRFLAKIALEALAERLKGSGGGLEYLVNHQQLDLIRNHARMGTTKEWPCNIRRIYATNAQWLFSDSGKGTSQVIHECDFLFPNIDEKNLNRDECIQDELYFIVALWGIEFAINMGGPEIEGYQQWLIKHDYISPLHFGKNRETGKILDNDC